MQQRKTLEIAQYLGDCIRYEGRCFVTGNIEKGQELFGNMNLGYDEEK